MLLLRHVASLASVRGPRPVPLQTESPTQPVALSFLLRETLSLLNLSSVSYRTRRLQNVTSVGHSTGECFCATLRPEPSLLAKPGFCVPSGSLHLQVQFCSSTRCFLGLDSAMLPSAWEGEEDHIRNACSGRGPAWGREPQGCCSPAELAVAMTMTVSSPSFRSPGSQTLIFATPNPPLGSCKEGAIGGPKYGPTGSLPNPSWQVPRSLLFSRTHTGGPVPSCPRMCIRAGDTEWMTSDHRRLLSSRAGKRFAARPSIVMLLITFICMEENRGF